MQLSEKSCKTGFFYAFPKLHAATCQVSKTAKNASFCVPFAFHLRIKKTDCLYKTVCIAMIGIVGLLFYDPQYHIADLCTQHFRLI